VILLASKYWLGKIFLWDVDFRALHKVYEILLVGYTLAAVCITHCHYHYQVWPLIISDRKPYLRWMSSAKISQIRSNWIRDCVLSNFTHNSVSISFIACVTITSYMMTYNDVILTQYLKPSNCNGKIPLMHIDTKCFMLIVACEKFSRMSKQRIKENLEIITQMLLLFPNLKLTE